MLANHLPISVLCILTLLELRITTYKMLVIVLFVLYSRDIIPAIAYDHRMTQTFIHDDVEYVLCKYEVTWDEARIICSSYSAELVIVDNDHKADLVVQAIADLNFAFDTFWIGARTNSTGFWIWTSTGKLVDTKTVLWNDPSLPQRANYISTEKECLAIDRKYHYALTFVPLKCSQQRPFVCQRYRNTFVAFNKIVTVVIGEQEFTLYSSRVAWPEAVAECRQHGLQIAEIRSMAEAEVLAIAMTRARPESIESAWIGGYAKEDGWAWLPSGDEILESSLWANRSNTTEGCLLLDRHVCELPVYIEARCDRKRDVVCQKPKRDTSKGPIAIYVEGCFYWVGRYPLKWADAKQSCNNLNASLVILDSRTKINHMMRLMIDIEGFRHIWTDGHVQDQKMKSHNDSKSWSWFRDCNRKHILDTENNFKLQCLMERYINRTNCLNLDRANYDTPIIYELSCDERQAYVCQPWIGTCTSNTSAELSPTTIFKMSHKDDEPLSTTSSTTPAISAKTAIKEHRPHANESINDINSLHENIYNYGSNDSYFSDDELNTLKAFTASDLEDQFNRGSVGGETVGTTPLPVKLSSAKITSSDQYKFISAHVASVNNDAENGYYDNNDNYDYSTDEYTTASLDDYTSERNYHRNSVRLSTKNKIVHKFWRSMLMNTTVGRGSQPINEKAQSLGSLSRFTTTKNIPPNYRQLLSQQLTKYLKKITTSSLKKAKGTDTNVSNFNNASQSGRKGFNTFGRTTTERTEIANRENINGIHSVDNKNTFKYSEHKSGTEFSVRPYYAFEKPICIQKMSKCNRVYRKYLRKYWIGNFLFKKCTLFKSPYETLYDTSIQLFVSAEDMPYVNFKRRGSC